MHPHEPVRRMSTGYLLRSNSPRRNAGISLGFILRQAGMTGVMAHSPRAGAESVNPAPPGNAPMSGCPVMHTLGRGTCAARSRHVPEWASSPGRSGTPLLDMVNTSTRACLVSVRQLLVLTTTQFRVPDDDSCPHSRPELVAVHQVVHEAQARWRDPMVGECPRARVSGHAATTARATAARSTV